MSCEIREFVKSHDFWKMCPGCFESPCCPFIELVMLLEWTHWNVALEIQMMETVCIGSGESDVKFPVALRAHRLESSDSKCHLFCVLSVSSIIKEII